jgi:hypothetical protein
MDARYLKATTALPSDVKVCGKRLLPFCLRHRLMLMAIDSPFLDFGKRGFTATDVIMAVRILSTYEKKGINDPINFMEKWHMIMLNSNRNKLARAVGRIIGIITKSCSYPKMWSKEKSTNKENIPWVLSCVANNVRNGCTLEEAWTMPEGEAVWMSISHAIYNGSKIEVLSTDDEKMLDKFDSIIDRFKQANPRN